MAARCWGAWAVLAVCLGPGGASGVRHPPQYQQYQPKQCRVSDDWTTANCSWSSLYHVPDHLPHIITHLDVSRNFIDPLPPLPLGYLNLISLNLSFNFLDSIAASTFTNLRYLQVLDISGNAIEYLQNVDSARLLSNKPNFEALHLRLNPLKSLDDSPLRSESLRDLDVSECEIRFLAGNFSLKWLPNIKKLWLSRNPLLSMELSSDSLEELYLSDTQLRELNPSLFGSLTKLRVLDISKNNQLTRLSSSGIPRSATLEVINASHCLFDALELSAMPAITQADYSSNRISSLLLSDLRYNHRLERLLLSDNWIKYVEPTTFSSAGSLMELDLSGNKIETLSDFMRGLESMTKLDVSRNPLKAMPGLKYGVSLRQLDASHCEMTALPYQLFFLPDLESANFSQNRIQDLPKEMSSLTLQELDLSRNRLWTVEDDRFRHLPRLRRLHLWGNRLTEPLHHDTLLRLGHTEFFLRDNPWRCECHKEAFQFFYGRVRDRGDNGITHCHSPENVTGVSWRRACFVEKRLSKEKEPKHHSWVPLVVSVVSVVMVLLILYAVARSRTARSRGAVPPPSPPPPAPIPRPPAPSPPPSYEEALLLPRPAGRKSDADTQTSPLADPNPPSPVHRVPSSTSL